MEQIKIGFDIDGVVLNYTEHFGEIFKLFGGEGDLQNPTEFNFYNLIQEEYHTALDKTFAYMMHKRLRFHKGIHQVLHHFLFLNRGLDFVTARDQELAGGIVYSMIDAVKIYTEFSTIDSSVKATFLDGHHSKLKAIKDLDLDYFVEDRRKNVLDLSSNGVIVFMPRRSWNTLPACTKNVIQYDNPLEILEYFKEEN